MGDNPIHFLPFSGVQLPPAPPAWAQNLFNRSDVIDAKIARLELLAALSHNGDAGDGCFVSFLEVPFPNGDLPGQFNLPALTSVNAVAQLNDAEAHAYHERYYPNIAVPQQIRACKQAICRAIGCQLMDPLV
ncbi:hypothetical protein BC827DRAFT_1194675 [Russula dissimulans]|nr:hypothetical protein BC827DRAFT_1194675 [Russula dissimulans]